jgi:hypothetical protein
MLMSDIHESRDFSHINKEQIRQGGGVIMGRDDHKGSSNNTASLPQTPKNQKIKPGNMREEISLELAELGNLKPKQEPMTPNQREKSEKEKH